MHKLLTSIIILSLFGFPALAQENSDDESISDQPEITAAAGPARQTLVGKQLSFDATSSQIPEGVVVNEILWSFGDGISTTGENVTHAYNRPGTYLVKLVINTEQGTAEDTTEVKVFDRSLIILADNSVSDEQIALESDAAAKVGLLLVALKTQGGGPEALVEEELAAQLASRREEVAAADLIVSWTTGGVGANVLSRFAQNVRATDELSFSDLALGSKGIIILTTTPFGVLSPVAQNTFDQLEPSFVLLTRPEALPLVYDAEDSESAKTALIDSPVDYRLFGTFSSRASSSLGLTNFLSFGISYLVNQGIPINNILLILTIPVIATILAFARQVIGIKSFGLITPAMTTLSFLVMGLTTGLIVFLVVLVSGTLTRAIIRKARLLYLPRMALVLTSASLAILVMFAVTAWLGQTATLSFSVFPILILTILAEEFIAVQFTRGPKTAFKITAWTLGLTVACYLVVSAELVRTFLLAYPETVLLAIPANLLLGRFTGLRLVEYFRFRALLNRA